MFPLKRLAGIFQILFVAGQQMLVNILRAGAVVVDRPFLGFQNDADAVGVGLEEHLQPLPQTELARIFIEGIYGIAPLLLCGVDRLLVFGGRRFFGRITVRR